MCCNVMQVGTIFQPLATYEMPPTYFPTTKVTSCFQTIVDAYGIARYREANPAVNFRCPIVDAGLQKPSPTKVRLCLAMQCKCWFDDLVRCTARLSCQSFTVCCTIKGKLHLKHFAESQRAGVFECLTLPWPGCRSSRL